MAGSTRTIATRIVLDGEAEFKKQMSSVNSELKTLSSELKLSESEFKGQANSVDALTEKDKVLTRQIDQQKEKVRALEQAVKDASEAYGDSDKRTDSYRQQLNNAKTALNGLNDDLRDNTKYLDEAKQSTDGCAKSIDGFGKEAKDAGKDLDSLGADSGSNGIGGIVNSLDSLKGLLAGGAVVGGIEAVAGAMFDVVESTEEYRKVLGTLEVSSKNAGYTTEQTEQTYRRLQSVLGDTQTAATATANLQAIGLSQKDLITVTDQAIGAWATYGDSIPIDGLAEAINETAQTGVVTGNFADVLNWAGTSEDDFNAKLAAANSTSERANIIMQELSKQGLKDAGQAWMNTNQDIVETNAATEEWNQALGKIGEACSPLVANLKHLGADGLSWLADRVAEDYDAFKKLGEMIDETFRKAQTFGTGKYGTGEVGGGGRSGVNGSHALGLDYVPFDGYIAELHKGERVLTAQEASVINGLASANLKTPSIGITDAQLQRVTAGAVNALLTGQTTQNISIKVPLNINGREFARATIDDIRAVSRSNPEIGSE